MFNKKIKLFIGGRKETFEKLNSEINSDDKVIWIHCASLGEFEQGRPIIEKIKQKYTNHKIVLTFFSPSGYEVRKNYDGADVVCYLPLDTKSNAKKFLNAIHPDIAIFVKYEFWPNILKALKERNVETILVSGIFRKDQAFFGPFGGWMRKSLKSFSHFFVQDENSQKLLAGIGIQDVIISGDTRFDRVNEIRQQNNHLDFIEEFKQEKLTFVAGSTWKEDEQLIVDYINNKASKEEKFIIAPHNINPKEIKELQNSLNKKTVLFSEKEPQDLKEFQVFIIDTIGILTKIYSYANIAYVGGGFETGLHNILEPATFGVPIIIGPKYDKFREAVELVNEGGCFVVYTKDEFNSQLKELFTDENDRTKKGEITKSFINQNIGATKKVLEYIDSKIF
ncbi:3-deoxy-D-manno-octulosonic acid transferase [Urechidicola croceus]|uniref:3-deoxy-D-manno-octulosonic acid transferase n=1 Tax=Urechidicola croceus TaxID=1850246 RepID=UPI0029371A61|nr:glycosyltransferase N-terminal domain-containing protein [Urechidicola croceus]